MGIGAVGAGSANPRDSAEYQDLSRQLQSTQQDLASTKAELRRLAGDLPEREEALRKAEAALKDRQTAVARREAAVRRAERAVTRRERAVGIAEAEVAANTIPGDGVFEVGVDMKAGTYKSSGLSGCYYAVLGDPNGNDIISNNITDGPAVVTVAGGQYFETSGCADWVLQR